MGKIFKYEWKKQMFSKYVIGGILLVLTLIFMIGTARSNKVSVTLGFQELTQPATPALFFFAE